MLFLFRIGDLIRNKNGEQLDQEKLGKHVMNITMTLKSGQSPHDAMQQCTSAMIPKLPNCTVVAMHFMTPKILTRIFSMDLHIRHPHD